MSVWLGHLFFQRSSSQVHVWDSFFLCNEGHYTNGLLVPHTIDLVLPGSVVFFSAPPTTRFFIPLALPANFSRRSPVGFALCSHKRRPAPHFPNRRQPIRPGLPRLTQSGLAIILPTPVDSPDPLAATIGKLGERLAAVRRRCAALGLDLSMPLDASAAEARHRPSSVTRAVAQPPRPTRSQTCRRG